MDLLGWDTVSTVSIPFVNRSLQQNAASLPSQFGFSGSNLGVAYSCQCSTGAWQVKGGSGDLLTLSIPISQGTMSASGGSVNLAGVEAVFTVSLQLLPAPDGARARTLTFDLSHPGQLGDAPRTGVVTPLNLAGPAATLQQLGDIGKGSLLNGLAGALSTHAASVAYVFARVSLTPPSGDGWLAPAESAYCFFETQGSTPQGYLAVLSSTTVRDVSGLPRNVPPELMTGNPDAGLAVSQDLFLANVIMPTLPQALSTGAGSFRYDAPSRTIVNTGTFGTESVKEGLITYYPNVSSLSVATNGDGLTMAVSGGCDLKAGISMTYSVGSRPTMTFNEGAQSIHFVADPNPTSSHDADIPWYYWFLGPVAEGITQLVVKLISDGIAGTLTSDLGENALPSAASQPVQWTGLRPVHVRSAVLNGSLVMQGSLS
jgi:Clostridium P-47 protein